MKGIMDNMESVNSPCVRNCSLVERRVCRGCFRTLDEIVDWSDADELRRRDILASAEARRDLENSAAALPLPA